MALTRAFAFNSGVIWIKGAYLTSDLTSSEAAESFSVDS